VAGRGGELRYGISHNKKKKEIDPIYARHPGKGKPKLHHTEMNDLFGKATAGKEKGHITGTLFTMWESVHCRTLKSHVENVNPQGQRLLVRGTLSKGGLKALKTG